MPTLRIMLFSLLSFVLIPYSLISSSLLRFNSEDLTMRIFPYIQGCLRLNFTHTISEIFYTAQTNFNQLGLNSTVFSFKIFFDIPKEYFDDLFNRHYKMFVRFFLILG